MALLTNFQVLTRDKAAGEALLRDAHRVRLMRGGRPRHGVSSSRNSPLLSHLRFSTNTCTVGKVHYIFGMAELRCAQPLQARCGYIFIVQKNGGTQRALEQTNVSARPYVQ